VDDPTDSCSDEQLVRSLGWKVHVAPLSSPVQDRWMVFLVRDEQRILARAPTLEQAWQLAAEQVELIDEMGN